MTELIAKTNYNHTNYIVTLILISGELIAFHFCLVMRFYLFWICDEFESFVCPSSHNDSQARHKEISNNSSCLLGECQNI